nr:hypothetical protein CFP56_04435 [Quercus suber]
MSAFIDALAIVVVYRCRCMQCRIKRNERSTPDTRSPAEHNHRSAVPTNLEYFGTSGPPEQTDVQGNRHKDQEPINDRDILRVLPNLDASAKLTQGLFPERVIPDEHLSATGIGLI